LGDFGLLCWAACGTKKERRSGARMTGRAQDTKKAVAGYVSADRPKWQTGAIIILERQGHEKKAGKSL